MVQWRARSAVALAIEDWQMVWRHGRSGRRRGVTDEAAAVAMTCVVACAVTYAMACAMAYAV